MYIFFDFPIQRGSWKQTPMEIEGTTVCNKGLIFRIYRTQPQNLKLSHKYSNLITKWAKDLSKHFSKEDSQ
jgi:hypothetical protein